MKTLRTITLFLLTGGAGSLFAQAVPDVIDVNNVTPQIIATAFENAYMSVNKELSTGNAVVIDDILKIYLDLDPNKKYLTYSVTFGFQDGVSEAKKLELVNKLNAEVLMIAPRYSASKNNIWVKYDYWIEGGVTPKSLILCEKQFVSALKLMLQKDTEKIVK